MFTPCNKPSPTLSRISIGYSKYNFWKSYLQSYLSLLPPSLLSFLPSLPPSLPPLPPSLPPLPPSLPLLRNYSLFSLADELADTIVDTRNHLGPDLMPLERYHVFNRGIFEVNNQTIISGQYYEACYNIITVVVIWLHIFY